MFRERRSSERWSGERFRKLQKGAGWRFKHIATVNGFDYRKIPDSNFEFELQRPYAFIHPTFNPAAYPYHILSYLSNLACNHSVRIFSGTRSSLNGGHRGSPHPPWGRRPREPPSSRPGPPPMDSTTLFIEGIHHKCSKSELRDFFKPAGKVVDSFISFKKRANRKWDFGFVRFRTRKEAYGAIHALDGSVLRGVKIRVTFAKYSKGGKPFPHNHDKGFNFKRQHRSTPQPSFRDHRPCLNVIKGKQLITSSAEQSTNNTPILFKDNIVENNDTDMNLRMASVVEKEQMFDQGCAASSIEAVVSSQFNGQAAMKDTKDNSPKEDGDAVENVFLKEDSTTEVVIASNTQSTEDIGLRDVPIIKSVSFGKNRSCRPVSLKKTMNTKDIRKFLGYYGPTKA